MFDSYVPDGTRSTLADAGTEKKPFHSICRPLEINKWPHTGGRVTQISCAPRLLIAADCQLTPDKQSSSVWASHSKRHESGVAEAGIAEQRRVVYRVVCFPSRVVLVPHFFWLHLKLFCLIFFILNRRTPENKNVKENLAPHSVLGRF